jgi:hypothetical protein
VTVLNRGPIGPDFGALARRYELALGETKLGELAEALGLSTDGLKRLRVGWVEQHRAWSFPMCDASSNVLGIRLRLPDGRKLAVRGGHEGLFVPSGLPLPAGDRLLIAEGPSDCAALLDLGFSAIGRPSCSGGTRCVREFVQTRRPTRVVIAADSDDPGRQGAARLASVLVLYAPVVQVIEPPKGIKDMRAWRQARATHDDIERAIQGAPEWRLQIGGKRS